MPRARALALLALLVGVLAAGCVDRAPGLLIDAEIVRPGPVSLVSPAHAERVDGRNVTLSWTLAGNATGWRTRALIDGEPVDACPFAVGRTSCALALEPGRVHRWSVEALPDKGGIVLGSERGFVTNARPGAPVLQVGGEGATQLPLDLRVTWAHALDADRDALAYRVVVRNATEARVACDWVAEAACQVPWRLRAGEALTLAVTARDPMGLEGPAATVNVTAARPVVLLHGWTGDATTWAIMAPELARRSFEVLDFDAQAPGLQLLGYVPDASNETIEDIALTDVLPEVRRALSEAGFSPDAPVDVVAHSMGGLVGRVLVERLGHGGQIATLTMVGTPNRGSPMSGPWFCDQGPEAWRGSCLQMEEGSAFLEGLGYAPAPPGTSYATVGGGRDTVAPDHAVRLDGVPHRHVKNGCHSGAECVLSIEEPVVPLTGSREVRDFLLEILGARPGPSG